MVSTLTWIFIIFFVAFAWIIYWQYIHARIPFKNKDLKNKELLKMDYERLNQRVYHLEIIGFTFFLGGLTIIEKGTIALVISGFGLLILILSARFYGMCELRHRWL